MSEIHIHGWEGGQPYASISDNAYIYLGVREIVGQRLPAQLGVNLDLARAEAVPIRVHNVVERYRAGDTTRGGLTIAVLGALSNLMLHPDLQHDHGGSSAITLQTKGAAKLAKVGVHELEFVIEKNREQYQDIPGADQYLEDLRHFGEMLDFADLNPRRFRIKANGSISRV